MTQKELPKLFLDRDYIQDDKGDLYQVIGSIHPSDGIMVIQKYRKVLHPKPDHFYWIQRGTQNKFERLSSDYSSKWVHSSMEAHPYTFKHPVFDHNVLLIPRNSIQNYWHPRHRLAELFRIFKNGSFQEKMQMDPLEREALEVASIFIQDFQITEANLGVSGSLLWQGQHARSDFDFVVYGWADTQRYLQKSAKYQEEKLAGLRIIRKMEILGKAERMHEKNGLTVEEAFEVIFHKSLYLYYKDRPFTIKFIPGVDELVRWPGYIDTTRYKSQGPITIRATVLSDRWTYYYPGLIQIRCDEILQYPDSNKPTIKEISRVLIFEQDFIGYFFNQDHIEIHGLLQECFEVPNFSTLNPEHLYQILLGSIELYGKEYLKRV